MCREGAGCVRIGRRQISDAKSAEAMMPCDPLAELPGKSAVEGNGCGFRGCPGRGPVPWGRDRDIGKSGRAAATTHHEKGCSLTGEVPAWHVTYKWPIPGNCSLKLWSFGWVDLPALDILPDLGNGILKHSSNTRLRQAAFAIPLLLMCLFSRSSVRVGTQDRTTASCSPPALAALARSRCGIYPL